MRLKRILQRQWECLSGFGLLAIGTLAVAVGYWGVIDSQYDAERLSFVISGGIGGVLLIGVGVTLLICADQSAQGRQLDRAEESIRNGEAWLESDYVASLTISETPEDSSERPANAITVQLAEAEVR